MAQGGWNLDIETRCTQEVVDAGEVRILQQRNRKKWWRGQRGKSTYEAKWMQEIERHRGGRESSILKQDERKKLLRDMPPPTFRPPSQVSTCFNCLLISISASRQQEDLPLFLHLAGTFTTTCFRGGWERGKYITLAAQREPPKDAAQKSLLIRFRLAL